MNDGHEADRPDAAGLARLYQQTVLEHSRRPRNFRRPERADREAQGHNLLCGDKLTVYLRLDGDRIAEAAFEGSGCAISLASASLMTEMLTGRELRAADETAAAVLTAFADSAAAPLPDQLAALGEVRAFPSRIRCATLAWRTAQAALEGTDGVVSTETTDTEDRKRG